MPIPRHALAAALLTLTALAGLPQAALAGCTPGVGSDGNANTCIGTVALTNNTTGYGNSATGSNALRSNTTGSYNSATGYLALLYNTTGFDNSATGSLALLYNTTGYNNSAFGSYALYSNTTGYDNSAFGYFALYYNTTGYDNSATGYGALFSNTTGYDNSATGYLAGGKQTGSKNTWLGAQAGWRGAIGDSITITGSNNIALGYQAGSEWTTGSNNIAIGNVGNAADLNTIRIGTPGVQSRTFIAGVRNVKVLKGQAVMVDANGQIGTSKSSIRYKEDVHSMGDASSPLMNLRPVTFRYKEAAPDGSKPIQYGLIAEEVEKVMPDLVIYNDEGTPESVAYEILPSLLLNEYQKQGRKLAAAEAKLAAAERELAKTRTALEESNARFEAELAALKLAVSRLAAAPSSVKLATTAP